MGLTLVKKLSAENFRVAATSRSAKALIEAVGEKSEIFLPLEMDLLDESSVQESINKTINAFGAALTESLAAEQLANRKIAELRKDLENLKSLTVSTDFENAKIA